VLLDDALTKLAGLEPRAAAIVQLRFFSGLTIEEAAEALGLHGPSRAGLDLVGGGSGRPTPVAGGALRGLGP
jgi:hypothetical protein